MSTEIVNQGIYTIKGPSPDLMMMYGGLEVEYVLFSHKLIHAAGQALVGWGALTEGELGGTSGAPADGIYDGFFVAEPGVNVELNVLPFFRLALGGGYLYVDGVELEGLTNGDLSGPTATLTFKFGSF